MEKNLPLAIEYYTKNIKMTGEIGDKDGQGKGFYNLALVYEDLQDKEKAIQSLHKALKCFTQAGSVKLIELTKQRLQENLQQNE